MIVRNVREKSNTGKTPPHGAIGNTFILLCVAGVALRLIAASAGDNYDMESWWIASEAFNHGESIYSATHRYNYGPIWFYILGGLRNLSAMTGDDTITRFHLFIAAFLSLVDLSLGAFILRRKGKLTLAALFILNPVSIIVTGYHIQFDNLAILLGLLSWQVFTLGTDRRSLLVAAALLGGSLTTKHIFSIFVAWLPFLTSVRTLPARLAYGALALAIFAGSFYPWVSDPDSLNGIVANVLRYTSTEGHSLTALISSLLDGVPQRTVFVLLLALCGALFLRFRPAQTSSPLIYITLLTTLSSGMARNYLAIPLVALVTLSPSITSWIYYALATVALCSVHPALGVTEVVLPLTQWRYVSYETLQVVLALSLVEVFAERRYE